MCVRVLGLGRMGFRGTSAQKLLYLSSVPPHPVSLSLSLCGDHTQHKQDEFSYFQLADLLKLMYSSEEVN